MNNYPLTDLEAKALDIIKVRCYGKEVTGAQLSTLLGIKDKDGKAGANMRSVINTLRDKGRVVCANSRGYYYPRTVEELAEYVDQFQNRIDEQQKACDIMKERVKQWFEINLKKIEDEKLRQGQLFNTNFIR